MAKRSPIPDLRGLAVCSKDIGKVILPPLDLFNIPPTTGANLTIPFDLDSEFVDNLFEFDPFDSQEVGSRFGVTCQIKGVAEDTGLIFTHIDLAGYAANEGLSDQIRHPVLDVDAHSIVVDWLRLRGINAEIFHDPELYAETRYSCRLVPVSHFSLADIRFLGTSDEFCGTIVELFKNRKLTMGRRLMARASAHAASRSGVVGLPGWLIRFNNTHTYKLTLEIVDSCALHGAASYADLASNVGVKLESKAAISRKGPNADIRQMHLTYFSKPQDFDDYALGDLKVSEILHRYSELMRGIYSSLHIPHRFQEPKPTIGSTVADIIKQLIIELIDPGSAEFTDELAQATTVTHSASHLTRLVSKKNPGALLGKVDGGRCRNAKPTTINMAGALCDIDISSAYGSAMSVALLVLGEPRLITFGNARDQAVNYEACISVSEFLRRHEHQLVPRAWYARIGTREPLSFDCDLFPSWFNWRIALRKSDTEAIEQSVDTNAGELKHLSREIWAGTLTSDLLDVARNTMSTRQFDEWADKTMVRAALFVNARDRLSVDEYAAKFRAGALKEHEWCGLTVGELMTDLTVGMRKDFQKRGGKGSPQDTLCKLMTNTCYGVSVSRHFVTSSTICGSNITGTVRSFMYLAEKGLSLVGSITDGQCFSLNHVLHPRQVMDKRRPPEQWARRPSDIAMSSRAYRLSDRELDRSGKAGYKPLVGNNITIDRDSDNNPVVSIHHDNHVETYVGKAAHAFIDGAALQHLQKLWPKIDILTGTFKVSSGLDADGHPVYVERVGLFSFESKAFVTHAVMHGSANYWHTPVNPNPDKPSKPKMRSFEADREHTAFTVDHLGEYVRLPTYDGMSPAHVFLGAIRDNPAAVPFFPPFLKSRILKPGAFAPAPEQGFDKAGKWRTKIKPHVERRVMPGDSVYVIGRPRLFSVAQFTYQTRDQFRAWKTANNRLVAKHGISFEQFFVNVDGTIDYVEMVQTIDDAICAGVVDPIAYLNKTRTRVITDEARRFDKAVAMMRDHLKAQVLIIDEDSEHYTHTEDWE